MADRERYALDRTKDVMRIPATEASLEKGKVGGFCEENWGNGGQTAWVGWEWTGGGRRDRREEERAMLRVKVQGEGVK